MFFVFLSYHHPNPIFPILMGYFWKYQIKYLHQKDKHNALKLLSFDKTSICLFGYIIANNMNIIQSVWII